MIPSSVRATLLLVVTLTIGIAIGVAYERRRMPAHDAPGMHHVMHRLNDQLDLDSAQQTAIAAIFARRQGTVDSTWHALRPHVRATMDSTLREIVDVLRPDQVAKYRKMVERMHPDALP
jgi:ABC-type thiamine transport system ATPase subunit